MLALQDVVRSADRVFQKRFGEGGERAVGDAPEIGTVERERGVIQEFEIPVQKNRVSGVVKADVPQGLSHECVVEVDADDRDGLPAGCDGHAVADEFRAVPEERVAPGLASVVGFPEEGCLRVLPVEEFGGRLLRLLGERERVRLLRAGERDREDLVAEEFRIEIDEHVPDVGNLFAELFDEGLVVVDEDGQVDLHVVLRVVVLELPFEEGLQREQRSVETVEGVVELVRDAEDGFAAIHVRRGFEAVGASREREIRNRSDGGGEKGDDHCGDAGSEAVDIHVNRLLAEKNASAALV